MTYGYGADDEEWPPPSHRDRSRDRSGGRRDASPRGRHDGEQSPDRDWSAGYRGRRHAEPDDPDSSPSGRHRVGAPVPRGGDRLNNDDPPRGERPGRGDSPRRTDEFAADPWADPEPDSWSDRGSRSWTGTGSSSRADRRRRDDRPAEDERPGRGQRDDT